MARPKKPAKSAAERTADRLTAAAPRVAPVPPEDFLSTGCTLMNMAFSGHPDRGVPKGTYWYVIGDSGASKTWMTFTLFAEAARNPNFAGYRFVHDNAENGALMDVERYFGAGVRDRLEPPAVKNGRAANSSTVQEFYMHLEQNCRRGPCVYALDSMDALNDDSDEAKFLAELKKFETGVGDPPGSMGMAKAKTNSKNINRAAQSLRDTGSILAVISQTRDKVGGHIPGMKTRGGGRALKFFAHLETWASVRGPITKAHHGKDREVGAYIKVDVQKNRVSGWEGKFEFAFAKGYGVDDPGSNVDYLVEECHWAESKKVITAPEFDFAGKREDLVRKIQDAGDDWELSRLVERVWNEIVAGAAPRRKPRYT